MSGLTKRVEALEGASGMEGKALLWEYVPDGGLVYDGTFYADTDALLAAVGVGQGKVLVPVPSVFGSVEEWEAFTRKQTQTQRASQPPESKEAYSVR